eukprot:TRINITY_DN2034_c0_g1_i8.p2 TRINITY_DN2034_c0_g1~~TRINITY_DN2034_c0_g1_i8.p2  ORF type:complete len:124 (-),score=19.41 TRINITY_DN2034_c0_g1_i8:663-1034(-)
MQPSKGKSNGIKGPRQKEAVQKVSRQKAASQKVYLIDPRGRQDRTAEGSKDAKRQQAKYRLEEGMGEEAAGQSSKANSSKAKAANKWTASRQHQKQNIGRFAPTPQKDEASTICGIPNSHGLF